MHDLAELQAETEGVVIDEPYETFVVAKAMFRSDLERVKAKIRTKVLGKHEPLADVIAEPIVPALEPAPKPTALAIRDAILAKMDREVALQARRDELAHRQEELRIKQELERVEALLNEGKNP